MQQPPKANKGSEAIESSDEDRRHHDDGLPIKHGAHNDHFHRCCFNAGHRKLACCPPPV